MPDTIAAYGYLPLIGEQARGAEAGDTGRGL